MSPQSQRIAIAEACGWYEIYYDGTENNGPESDINPLRLVGKWSKRGVGSWAIICSLPDYLNDLNAMHEAEKVLNEKQEHIMNDTLWDLMSGRKYLWHATAPQRAEAFLRTLGKWEEGK